MKRLHVFLFLILGALVSHPMNVSAAISITNGLTQEKELRAGETYQGTIMIRNQGDKPAELKVYQSDYWFNHEGDTKYGEPGKDPRSNASWISITPQKLSVPPMAEATVNYTIKVPEDKPLTGTYWSMVLVEQIPETSLESSEAKKDKKLTLGITQIMRYGIQMITHMGDSGKKHVKFLQSKLLKDKDLEFLQVDMENDGERLLRPQLWVEILTMEGVSLGKFKGDQFRIFPTTSKRFRIDVPNVIPGTYKALVIADCGEDDIFGIQYTLKFEK